MSAAAVITAGLIVAPALSPRDQDQSPLASRTIQAINGSPVLVATRFEPPVIVAASPARVPLSPRRTTTASSTWVPRPAMTTVVTVSARMESPRKPLARRLAGFLTGDGSHTIRPFPTVPADR
jgi:hypothetical protein